MADVVAQPTPTQGAPGRTRNNRLFGVVAVVITLFVFALVIYPLGTVLIRTYLPGGVLDLSPFSKVFLDPDTWTAIWSTAAVVGVAGGIAMVIGALFAWFNERTDASLGPLGALVPLLPFLMPPIAMSVGWVFLASSRAGILNVLIRSFLERFGIHLESGPLSIESVPGLVFVYVVYLVPLVFVTVASAFRSMDPAMEEASRTSGAGILRTARLVAIPALLPALAGAAVLVVVAGVSVYSIPSIIGTAARVRTVSVAIVEDMQQFPPASDEAVTLGLAVSLVVGLLWLFQRRVASRGRHATIGGRPGSGAVVRLGRWRWLARLIMVGYLLLASVLPLAALTLVALQPFWSPDIDISKLTLNNFTKMLAEQSIARQSIINSVVLGVVGATITMVLVVILTVWIRDRGNRQTWLADVITKVPAGIPHVVVGVAFILAFAIPPFNLYGSQLILLLAYMLVYLPQGSISAGTSYDQVGRSVIEASLVSGADRARTMRRVIAPLMLPGIIAGWTLLFVLMVGELNVSIILAAPASPVVGFVFMGIWENGTYSTLAALGTVVSFVSATLIALLLIRSRGAAGALGGTS